MGRHSAPDDDALDAAVEPDEAARGGVAVAAALTRRGRHSRTDEAPADVPGTTPAEVAGEAPADRFGGGAADNGLSDDLTTELLGGLVSAPDDGVVLAPPRVVTEDAEDAYNAGDAGDAGDGEGAEGAAGGAAGPPGIPTLTVPAADAPPAEHAAVPLPDALPETTAAPATRGSRSDLLLLREHGDVRARVIAGVVAPFAIFTIVMALLGQLDRSYLLWIWIPLVTAGVLGGLFLDVGHRRYRSDA